MTDIVAAGDVAHWLAVRGRAGAERLALLGLPPDNSAVDVIIGKY